MFRSIVGFVILILFVLVACTFANGDEANIKDKPYGENPLSAFGGIYKNNPDGTIGQWVGSGFVAVDKKTVFTCAHVALENVMQFKPYNSEYFYNIDLQYFVDGKDVAVFKRRGGEFPFRVVGLGDYYRCRPGDSIIYVGLENGVDIKAFPGVIWGVGEYENKGEIVRYLEFTAKAKLGYSGGPVFDKNYNVIGMIAQVFDLVPLRGEKKYRICRAVSIEDLKTVEEKMQKKR